MAQYTCAHCGQTCGDYAGGYGGVSYADGPVIHLCHPNEPGRPDCYRRVSIYSEQIGILRGVDPKPPGVTGCASAEGAFQAMVDLTEELRLYGDEQKGT